MQYRIERKQMNKLKLIKKLTSLVLIGGGILTSLPFAITSCSNNEKHTTNYYDMMKKYIANNKKVFPSPNPSTK
jgi:hypothetical protein